MMATSSVPRQEAKFCALAGGKVLCLGRRQSCDTQVSHLSLHALPPCLQRKKEKKKKKEKENLFHLRVQLKKRESL